MNRLRWIFVGLMVLSVLSIVGAVYFDFGFPFLFLLFPPLLFGGGWGRDNKQKGQERGASNTSQGPQQYYTGGSFCPNCGNEFKESWNFCPNCSQPRKSFEG